MWQSAVATLCDIGISKSTSLLTWTLLDHALVDFLTSLEKKIQVVLFYELMWKQGDGAQCPQTCTSLTMTQHLYLVRVKDNTTNLEAHIPHVCLNEGTHPAVRNHQTTILPVHVSSCSAGTQFQPWDTRHHVVVSSPKADASRLVRHNSTVQSRRSAGTPALGHSLARLQHQRIVPSVGLTLAPTLALTLTWPHTQGLPPVGLFLVGMECASKAPSRVPHKAALSPRRSNSHEAASQEAPYILP